MIRAVEKHKGSHGSCCTDMLPDLKNGKGDKQHVFATGGAHIKS